MPVAASLLHFPELLRYMTIAVLQWEYWGPFLFFSPVLTEHMRLIGSLGFVAMHIGFGVCLRLGLFFWIGVTANVLLLPSLTWRILDSLGQYFCPDRREQVLCVHHTANVPMYHYLANHILPYLWRGTIHVEAHEGDGYGASFQISYAKQSYDREEALQFIIEHSWTCLLCLHKIIPLGKVLWWLFSSLSGDDVRSFVSPHRGLEKPLRQKQKNTCGTVAFWVDAFTQFLLWLGVIISIIIIIQWTFNDIHVLETTPEYWNSGPRKFAILSHLDQQWAMFSPRPPMEDWWYFIEGRLSNNSTLELFHNQGIRCHSPLLLQVVTSTGMFNWKGSTDMSKEKRWNFYKSVSNHRWMKFYETINYGSAGSEPMKLELGKCASSLEVPPITPIQVYLQGMERTTLCQRTTPQLYHSQAGSRNSFAGAAALFNSRRSVLDARVLTWVPPLHQSLTSHQTRIPGEKTLAGWSATKARTKWGSHQLSCIRNSTIGHRQFFSSVYISDSKQRELRNQRWATNLEQPIQSSFVHNLYRQNKQIGLTGVVNKPTHISMSSCIDARLQHT